jgi:hypothetical protein
MLYDAPYSRQFLDARQRYIEDCYSRLAPDDKATVDAVTARLDGIRGFGEISAHELIFQAISWRMKNESN